MINCLMVSVRVFEPEWTNETAFVAMKLNEAVQYNVTKLCSLVDI